MSLGFVVILIVVFGYISNWLNWHYLNYRLTHLLYYVGAFVHESSHAILCVLTGAKIKEFQIFTDEPHVTHSKSKLPIIGNMLISLAPIFGGLVFIFLINVYLLKGQFHFELSGFTWQSLYLEPLNMIKQLNILSWQTWVMILFFINIGAMIGPSFRDMINIWLAIVILFFIHIQSIEDFGLSAVYLIIIGIFIQLILIICAWLFRKIFL